VVIRLPSGSTVRFFNVHLMHTPYQPYQLLKIPYGNEPFIQTAEQAVSEARRARGDQVKELTMELDSAMGREDPIFLTGDLNEPSHLDWTMRAAQAGRCPMAVPYPSTKLVTDTGLRDAYRAVFPDEVARPGWTWTPLTAPTDPKDRHDRIDFVFFAGRGVQVNRCEVVGESTSAADIVVQPYPSDHRAVVATVNVP
jgi:exodeoxyribonuclease-3